MAYRRNKSYRSKRRWPKPTYRHANDEPRLFEALYRIGVAAVRGIRWVVGRLAERGKAKVSEPPPLPPVAQRVGGAEAGLSVQPLPYRRRPHLISKGERAFWYPLYQAVHGKYRIFCKVRLQDVVSAPSGVRSERYWFNKIRGYHLDFVLCDPKTTAPLLAIELDDRSHASAEQTERDRFKDEVLAAGGVPIYRVPAQQAYDPIELAAQIAGRILS